jgi:hypothetical protein
MPPIRIHWLEKFGYLDSSNAWAAPIVTLSAATAAIAPTELR